MHTVVIDPLIGIADVEKATSLERSTIFRRQKRGEFPAHQYIANRRVWRASVIAAWIDEQLSRRELTRGFPKDDTHAA